MSLYIYLYKWMLTTGNISETVKWAEDAPGEAIIKTKNHNMHCPYIFKLFVSNKIAVKISNKEHVISLFFYDKNYCIAINYKITNNIFKIYMLSLALIFFLKYQKVYPFW